MSVTSTSETASSLGTRDLLLDFEWDAFGSKTRVHDPLVWNFPSALPRGGHKFQDANFEKRKKELAHRVPILTVDEIAKYRLPYHVILIHELQQEGFSEVAKEIRLLFRKQENDRSQYNHTEDQGGKLEDKKELLEWMAEGLKYCASVFRKGQYVMAVSIRSSMAEQLVKMGFIWIACHFYRSCMNLANQLLDHSDSAHIKCEIKCILGYFETEKIPQSEASTRIAMNLLEESRALSKDKDWLFHSHIVVLKLKKPISLYGLREDYTTMNGHSMTVHTVATLLLIEVYQTKAGAIVFSSSEEYESPSQLQKAEEFSNAALELGAELHESTASISAAMTIGAIQMKKEAFGDALIHLREFQKHASIMNDVEAEAIAFNMIGCCYMGLKDPIQALESFVWQKEIAEAKEIRDLELDAIQNIGYVLLLEGQSLEAELCFDEAHHGFRDLERQPTNAEEIIDDVWVKAGIVRGLGLWGRFGEHCRRGYAKDYDALFAWKSHRESLPKISHVPHYIPHVTDVFDEYDALTKIPTLNKAYMQSVYAAAMTQKLTLRHDDGMEVTPSVVASTLSMKYSKYYCQDKIVPAGHGYYILYKTEHHQRFFEEEGEGRTIYESDLRPTVTKHGEVFKEGQSRWKLGTRKKTLVDDPENPDKKLAKSFLVVPTRRTTKISLPAELNAPEGPPEVEFETVELTEEADNLYSDADAILVQTTSSNQLMGTKTRRVSELERTESEQMMALLGQSSKKTATALKKSRVKIHHHQFLTKAKLRNTRSDVQKKVSLWTAVQRSQMNRLSSSRASPTQKSFKTNTTSTGTGNTVTDTAK